MRFLLKKWELGSVLIVTLITCGVIATVLASYLLLLSSRYNLTARSMAWNATMPVLEAGIEEAMTHLQYDTNSPGANGWEAGTYGGQTVNTKTRHFAGGSYALVNIADAGSDNPTIYSSGFAPAPLGQGYISRTVKVTATRPKRFSAAIAANGLVNMTAGTVDSYSSCLGAYSTISNGLGTNGSIATNYRAVPAIKVTAGKVYGTVTTGPGGNVTVSGTASVGEKVWNATKTGLEPDWKDDTMNVAFPPNAPPPGPYEFWPALTPVGGPIPTNITYLSTGTYSNTSFSSISRYLPMIVTGDAILYLSGNVNPTNATLNIGGLDGNIQIKPGASLTLYVGGRISAISGGGVANSTGQPANFTYYGLNANTNLTVSGSGQFTGTINAPQATLTVNGTAAIFGAAIVNTYNGNSTGGFHYDECLPGTAPFLTITGWREL